MTDATPRWYTCHCRAAVPDGEVWVHKLFRHGAPMTWIAGWSIAESVYWGAVLGAAWFTLLMLAAVL